jgi:hypothetical protein
MSSDALCSGICRIKEVLGIEVWFDPESSDLQTEETEWHHQHNAMQNE